jgi:hypothetical protein
VEIYYNEFVKASGSLGGDVGDLKALYTNELVAEANKFDQEAIRRSAREWRP